MTDTLEAYEAYLRHKRFSIGTITAAMRFARKISEKYTRDEIIGAEIDDLIRMLSPPDSKASYHRYRLNVTRYRDFLMNQEVQE